VLADRNPARLNALIEDDGVDAHRNFSCADYDACLDEALRQRWRSWTCSRCPAFAAHRAPGLAASAPASAA
jgi:hypothetical protein